MTIPRELENYGWKIGEIVLGWLIVFILVFLLKESLKDLLTPLMGQENVTQLVWAIFLTPVQLILEQYGLGVTTLVFIGLYYLSQKLGK